MIYSTTHHWRAHFSLSISSRNSGPNLRVISFNFHPGFWFPWSIGFQPGFSNALTADCNLSRKDHQLLSWTYTRKATVEFIRPTLDLKSILSYLHWLQFDNFLQVVRTHERKTYRGNYGTDSQIIDLAAVQSRTALIMAAVACHIGMPR